MQFSINESVQTKHKGCDVALDTFTHLSSAEPSKVSNGLLFERADQAALVNTTRLTFALKNDLKEYG